MPNLHAAMVDRTGERVTMTDANLLVLALHGCNAAEIAAYAHISEEAAQARMSHVLRAHALCMQPKPHSNREVS